MAQKDISWFVAQRERKVEELRVAREKAKSINKEIRELNKQITANLKDMLLNNTKVPIDDNNFGWIYQDNSSTEKSESK
jgi:hypothetical protein